MGDDFGYGMFIGFFMGCVVAVLLLWGGNLHANAAWEARLRPAQRLCESQPTVVKCRIGPKGVFIPTIKAGDK